MPVGPPASVPPLSEEKTNDGVVELADRLEESDQAPDVLVDAVEHRRIGFHVAREERAVGGSVSSHRGARGSEAGSRVPGGTRPVSSWRRKRAARIAVQPAS